LAPEMRRTSRRLTPSASATATSAASVALPSVARGRTATTNASPYVPPTRVDAAPGLTRIVSRVTAMSHHHLQLRSPGQVFQPTVERPPEHEPAESARLAGRPRRLAVAASRRASPERSPRDPPACVQRWSSSRRLATERSDPPPPVVVAEFELPSVDDAEFPLTPEPELPLGAWLFRGAGAGPVLPPLSGAPPTAAPPVAGPPAGAGALATGTGTSSTAPVSSLRSSDCR